NCSSRRKEAHFEESQWNSASYSENEIRGNARPHPCPLPQERGKHAQFPRIFTPFVVALLHADLRRLLWIHRRSITAVEGVRPTTICQPGCLTEVGHCVPSPAQPEPKRSAVL